MASHREWTTVLEMVGSWSTATDSKYQKFDRFYQFYEFKVQETAFINIL